MDFISSISFPNETLTSRTFLDHCCHHFWVGMVLLCCCTHPKVMTKKKCSTDQRFIRKRNTTYKIHTLVNFFFKSSISADIWRKICLFLTSRISHRMVVAIFNSSVSEMTSSSFRAVEILSFLNYGFFKNWLL